VSPTAISQKDFGDVMYLEDTKRIRG